MKKQVTVDGRTVTQQKWDEVEHALDIATDALNAARDACDKKDLDHGVAVTALLMAASQAAIDRGLSPEDFLRAVSCLFEPDAGADPESN